MTIAVTPMQPTSPPSASPQTRHPLDVLAREPHTCIWEITLACNLNCVHCENHAGVPAARELALARLKGVAEELQTLGCRLVDITGGEPLLRPGWDEFCGHIAGLGIDVALVTNGTLLDEEAVERAVQARIRAIAVSIDGLRETHDATRRYVAVSGSTFDAAVMGIRRARQRLPVSVITQVNRTNLHELPDIGRMLGQLGVSHWQLQLAIPTRRVVDQRSDYVIAPADLEQLTAFIVAASRDPEIPMIHTSDNIGYATGAEVILRRKASGPGVWLGCIAGIRSVAIKYDGTVRGCSLLPREFDAGNLHESTLTEIWNDRHAFAYSAEFERSHLHGACARCQYGMICRAGCTTMAYFAGGTTGNNPYCLHRVRAGST
jgi:radical SAM protein with 4Fe4S-binding SPASM domain